MSSGDMTIMDQTWSVTSIIILCFVFVLVAGRCLLSTLTVRIERNGAGGTIAEAELTVRDEGQRGSVRV